ncbi:MAG: ribulose-phosphate 3-epimerase [Ruminococcaceae bacterium]|nr:ribulose-phosphate 3-epimerase [Oscillospiraceae bacterium]
MSEIWNEKCIISPSLISVCDMCNLEPSVRQLEDAGIEMLHVDILDGHFSPSMPLGLDTVRQLRKKTEMFFDVHVMTTAHDFFVAELLDIGVQSIVFHGEMEPHMDYRLNQIRKAGVKAGVAMKPATPLSSLDYVLEKCDGVLLMLINPGYAQERSEGQVPYASRKVRELHEMIVSRGLDTKVILDGRISKENMIEFAPDGIADIFVAGSTCLDKKDLKNSALALREFRNSILK